MNSTHPATKQPEELRNSLFIEEHRTYTRNEIFDIYPWIDKNLWPVLIDLFGLLPMGTGHNQIVLGRNLIESLLNHARGQIVERQRKPITRDKLNQIRKNLQKIES